MTDEPSLFGLSDCERFTEVFVREVSGFLIVLDKLCCSSRFDAALDDYAALTKLRVNGVLRTCNNLDDRSFLLRFLHWELGHWWHEQKCRGELPNVEAWQIECGDTNNPPTAQLEKRSPIIDFRVQSLPYQSRYRLLRFQRASLEELDAAYAPFLA